MFKEEKFISNIKRQQSEHNVKSVWSGIHAKWITIQHIYPGIELQIYTVVHLFYFNICLNG